MAWTVSCLYAVRVYQSLMLGISGQFHAIFVCRGIRRRASVKTGKTMADTINIGKAIHDELLRQGRTVAWSSPSSELPDMSPMAVVVLIIRAILFLIVCY